MKLRNKKTGEIGKLHCDMNVNPTKYGVFEDTGIRGHYWEYDSLAELNEEWEDYKPKEPLIKDDKIRKAVRAWAEANEREYLLVIKSGGRIEISDGSPHLIYISFHVDNDTLKSIDDRTYYPIDELCGEEEA